jgi:hypothetical protein
MRSFKRIILVITALLLILVPGSASAQNYSFSLDREIVDVYWESDGTARIDYQMTFTNDPSAHALDYIDIGMPMDSSYSLSNVTASVNGAPITDIEDSPVVSPGIALGLGADAIAPGGTGTVRMAITGVGNVLFQSDVSGYASVGFAPSWFDKQYVHGTTDMTVNFHLPPGVKPDEPRWHASPSGWPASPDTSLDSQGRVLYSWNDPSANGYTAYVFGASFPLEYVPASAVQKPSLWQRLGISQGTLTTICCVGGILVLIGVIIAAATYASRRRKLDYLPPKISIEGHGIKRGLTAVEAAILLERPLDRILTMILFGVVKKGAARVTAEDPLQVEAISPEPEDLNPYEKEFLAAVTTKEKRERERALQKVSVNLVKAVQKKMKGFSLSDTQKYYRSIVDKAWNQVEAAETPEVRSERYMDDLEWTMLDRDFDDRTRRVFRTGPVFIPVWWGAYRPSYSPSAAPSTGRPVSTTATTGAGPAGRVSLPSLPGGQFAASVVTSVQNTAGNLVSSLASFTGGVTKTTNPPPPPSTTGTSFRGSSGGGCACACACACAGCACACAGGGR